jgi:hypothetical protein
MSAASFQSSQFSVAPARESDHGLPGLAVKKALSADICFLLILKILQIDSLRSPFGLP